MDINFTGKYKSINSFSWTDIPNFVVITGPNGSGKSQLLELIYNSITFVDHNSAKATVTKEIRPDEVTFLKGEWQLQNTDRVSLYTIQQTIDAHYSNFRTGNYQPNHESRIKMYYAFQEILKKTGKHNNNVTQEEFNKHFPEVIIEQESQLSRKIGEVFYNYRLSEIELQASQFSEESIIKKIGEKPWVVLREIIKASKLPFDVNDPSNKGIKDGFQLKLTHQILNEEVNFNDLSSGEKVLISLVFYLYNSQEKNIFPRLLLLDEPDAHLHPSMCQQFISVIKNVLVDRFGVQVIMTTHSPSTVILAPPEAIYEMSRLEPRIKKSPSRNHSASILTAGLVYVGEGTKYFLVEDTDDATFYSYAYNQLTTDNLIDGTIPLVFIPASTKDKSGGQNVVQNWTTKLIESGLTNIVHGLIDKDSGNDVSEGVYKIDRYSIENYLVDPILVYAVLIDKEKNSTVEGLSLTIGEEYKLKSLSNEMLQKIADNVISNVEPELHNYFPDIDAIDKERVKVDFTNGEQCYFIPNGSYTDEARRF